MAETEHRRTSSNRIAARVFWRLAVAYSGPDKLREFEALTRHGFRKYSASEVEQHLGDAGFRSVRTVALEGAVTRGEFVTVGSKSAHL